jgi:hypothetical protein
MNHRIRIVTCAAFLLVLPVCGMLAQTSVQTPSDPYLTWSGPEYKWPQNVSTPVDLESVLMTDADGVPVRELHIRGNSMDVSLGIGALGPFSKNVAVSAPQIRPDSLVLSDSRAGDGVLCFTHFGKGAYIPEVNNDALMGVAKALMEESNPNTGVKVEIVEPPSDLPRKELLLMSRPRFLTWHLVDPASKTDLVCTDYFFTLPDDSLLVVSAVSRPGNHASLKADAEQLMRYSSIVNPDADKKEPAKPDNSAAAESQP